MSPRQRVCGAVATRAARRLALQRLLVGGTCLATPPWSAVGADTSPWPQPEADLPALRRGLNLTHWFEYEGAQAVAAPEMQRMRQFGLDHVRLPFDPSIGGWQPHGGARLEGVPALRRAIDMALAAGLAVVVDLHLTGPVKQQIEDQAEAETALLALWAQLAKALASVAASGVAFELLNEPQYYGAQAKRWPPLQRRLLDVVRAAFPHHLVLLSGNQGGSLEGLLTMPPLHDAAVAWVYHCYEPFFFTHQGAAWLDTRYTTAGLYQGVPYPAREAALAPPKLRQWHPLAAGERSDYLAADWGPQRVRAAADRAGAWARQRGIRLLCNEFGVIRANVDPASRYRWLGDMRRALEANHIGWTVWDYTDIFGLTAQSAEPGWAGHSDARTLEADAVRALGLKEAH